MTFLHILSSSLFILGYYSVLYSLSYYYYYYYYVVGSSDINSDWNVLLSYGFLQDLVEDENLHYSDIIQEGFVDSYNNLTLKSVMMLKWVSTNCRSVRYIMKTDDDMFVNINNLVRLLKVRNMSNLLVGALICGARPIADTQNKWWVCAVFTNLNSLKNYGMYLPVHIYVCVIFRSLN